MTNMKMKKEDQRYPSIPLAQTIVQFCEAKQIQHIVISPGSRNAPLTKGFTHNTFFKTYSIVDERAAAFFALGIAQQTQQAVALVCTSGSALLNYYPAIAEAYYSDIPLVILSADRLPHQIDIGDGQTIRQKHVFEPHIEDAAYLDYDVSHATERLLNHPKQEALDPNSSAETINTKQLEIQLKNEKAINRVLNNLILKKGPVHLNIPFEEPLYETTSHKLSLSQSSLPEELIKEIELTSFYKKWNKCSKKMILVGVLPPDSLEAKIIEFIAADPSVTVLTETTSNLSHYTFLESIDTLIAPIENNEEQLEKIRPEILLTFGGMIVSKKIKAFLRDFSPVHHYHVDEKKAYDTFYCLTDHFKLKPSDFFSKLIDQTKEYSQSDYCVSLLTQYNKHKIIGLNYLQNIPFSDLKAFELIFKHLPKDIYLHLANSSTIRYGQLFKMPSLKGIYCNRGTSGIDGSTATAMGFASNTEVPTVLITGDLSFFYDINGLWNNYLRPSTRIILINNQGGGIFRILPGEKDTPAYVTYYETVQTRDARSLCKSLGLGYHSASSKFSLSWKLKYFFSPSNKPQLLEIKTPRKLNDSVLLDYFKSIKDQLR